MSTLEARLKDLMGRGLDGDAVAYRALLSELSPFLRGFFARRLSGGDGAVEDLVQDTLIAIHVKRETFDRGQPFTPWAYAIARYKLIDHFRRTGVRKSVPLEHAEDLLAEGNPEEGAVRRDVAKLLAALPDKQAEILRDVKIEGLSMEETAARRGMSVTAVKVTVHRAMKRLAERVRHEDQ